MTKGLLSTGEVARRLGSSRQHVVDLCDRGALPSVRVGVHRRVPADAVEALLHDGLELSREQERSLWLHRAVLGELAADPAGALRIAQDNIARWRNLHRPGGMAERWMDRWGQLVQDGPDTVAEVLVSRTPEAVELRQNTPFAGVLSQQRRREVLDAFNRYWRDDHEGTRTT